MDAPWVKSSFSFANGNCVEVAELPGNSVGIRDSRDPGGANRTRRWRRCRAPSAQHGRCDRCSFVPVAATEAHWCPARRCPALRATPTHARASFFLRRPRGLDYGGTHL